MYGYEILHEEIAENLIDNVRTGNSPHAYIFEGEAGVGSFEAALLFAAVCVCERKDAAPCTTCRGCVMAKAKTHPDINVISPLKDKKNITVDQIREVVKGAYTKPYESGKKVYIIKYADDMNEQAQNAFLKVLEEPPEYAVFVLLAQNHEALLQTIRSRGTLIRFSPISNTKMREYIKAHFPEEEKMTDFLVRYAGGVCGNVEKILAQENFVPLRAAAFDKLEDLLSDDMLTAYATTEFMEENKEDADLVLSFWQDFIRDIMLIKSDAKDLVANTDFIDKLINMSNRISEKRVVKAQEKILLAQKMRRRYVSLRTLSLWLAFTIKN